MPRFAYVNGRYVPHAEARVHVEDRGYQFADGVYEVVTVINGHLVDYAGHMARLGRSLEALRIAWPMSTRALDLVLRSLVARNRVQQGLVYLQVTRGVAPRDFKFPPATTRSALVITSKRMPTFASPAQVTGGVSVITIPDIRWQRRDIKSVSLLPQVLGKQQAVEAGAFEAWQVDDAGMITEGCSSNAWIVTANGVLVTRAPTHAILNGITRQSLLRLAGELGIPFEERSFTVAEAYAAQEAFLSSATTFALPITRIDDRIIGSGRPGPLGQRLRQAYLDYAVAPVTESEGT